MHAQQHASINSHSQTELWNQEPLTSHLNFHCNCNQWLPSNVICFHSIPTASAVKEIGREQPAYTNKDKKRVVVRRKLTLHDMPLQTVLLQKQRIWFDTVRLGSAWKLLTSTFDMVMAFLKSLPPNILKPHGDGPIRFTVSAI